MEVSFILARKLEKAVLEVKSEDSVFCTDPKREPYLMLIVVADKVRTLFGSMTQWDSQSWNVFDCSFDQ